MGLEMDRSLSELRQDSFEPPYFAAYRLTDSRVSDVIATLGALTGSSDSNRRTLYIELRVGDRSFDNTSLQYRGWNGMAAWKPEVLRHNLWRLSDAAYKAAVSGLLRKKAKRATELIQDELDDFSVEKPETHSSPSAPAFLDRGYFKPLVLRLSRILRRYPLIYDSRVVAAIHAQRRYLMTSEGTRLATDGRHVPGVLRAWASTRASDGMKIYNQVSWNFKTLDDLPAEKELSSEIVKMARETMALRDAPLQSPMSAPAILDPKFTGVLFHEAIGHKLEGQRQRDPGQSQVFKDRVGKKVMPAFLTLIDDPTMDRFGGVHLGGYYAFDSEGVAARRVVLVERGILRNFLMSRWPVKGFDRSNGHGRSNSYLHPTGRMANLIVKAHRTLPVEKLFARLRSLIRKSGKEYGFYLVGSFGGENPNSRRSPQTLEVRPRLVFRVDAKTGRRTLVRGVKMVGTPLGVLNRIVAAGDDAAAAGGFMCGAESGQVAVSQVAPSVLIEEIELQRLPEDRLVPPLLPSPFEEAR